MVKQRFRVLFRRWFFTVARVCGPILLYELLVLVWQHFRYAPFDLSVLQKGALLGFLLTASLCWLWAPGERTWSSVRRLRGFVDELWQCSRSYWKPVAVRINKA